MSIEPRPNSRTPSVSDGALPRQDGRLRDEPLPSSHLDSLEAVARAATPGEWRLDAGDHTHRYAHVLDDDDRTIHYKYASGTATEAALEDANAAHIATFDPPTALALISSAREVERLREALTPSTETKAAYIGEFTFDVFAGLDEEGNDIYEPVTVPWTTVKQIMAAIQARARQALNGGLSRG